MKHSLPTNSVTIGVGLGEVSFLNRKSNPKKATKRFIVWWLLNFSFFFSAFFPTTLLAESPKARFVSLTLCSDRLLLALADSEQIAALSPYATQKYAMLDKVNRDKPVVKPVLTDFLTFADATILLNKSFYPQLTKQLEALGFRVYHLDDNLQSEQDFYRLLTELGALLGQERRAEKMIRDLEHSAKKLLQLNVKQREKTATLLADSGQINSELPQYKMLFRFLHLRKKSPTASGQFSPEKLILANPDVLITLATAGTYSQQGQWLTHPALARWAKTGDKAVWHSEGKFFYCFDHGVWQGAAQLMEQRQ